MYTSDLEPNTSKRNTRMDDDPLHLQSSDHPELSLVTSQLHEKNYLQWRIAMEIALGAKMKLGFVNGVVIEPYESDPEYNQWLRVDRMVKSWILNEISKEIVIGFWYSRTAYELWNDLKDQFGESNGPMMYKMQQDICSIRQGSLSVTMYYTTLKKLWDGYHVLEPIPVCTCGAGRLLAKHTTRNRLIHFLVRLQDCYDSIRDQILLLDSIPSVAKAYSMVLRVEQQRDNQIQFGEMVEQSVHLARSKNTKGYGSKSTKMSKDGDKYCSCWKL